MDGAWWMFLAVIGAIGIAGGALAWRPCRTAWRDSQLARARRDFHHQREHLEARFLQIAANSGKPRGLEWTGCDFDDAVVYARHRST